MDGRCDKYISMTEEYAAGRLSAEQRAELESHCAECASCAARLEEEKEIARLVSESLESPPAELAANVMKEVRAEKGARRVRIIRRTVGIAAALILVVGAALTIPRVTEDGTKSAKSDEPAIIAEGNQAHDDALSYGQVTMAPTNENALSGAADEAAPDDGDYAADVAAPEPAETGDVAGEDSYYAADIASTEQKSETIDYGAVIMTDGAAYFIEHYLNK